MKINTKQFKTKNFKGVLSLLAGNTLSKLILTLGGFVLANYYGPENFAFYNVFLSYVMILPVLSSFRLDNIMILQKGSKEIRNIFSGTIWISLMFTILLIFILALVKKMHWFDLDMSYFVLVLCGVGAILTAWNNTQNSLFTKFKLFKQMSTAFVISSVFAVIFQLIFYFTKLQEDGLIYGWIVGLLASFIYNARVSKDRLGAVDISLFKKSVKEHFEIVKFTYPSDSINALANHILPILVIAYFEAAEVGVYMMAFKILSTPLLILGSSISRVYFQKSVTLYNHDRLELWKLTKRMIYINVGVVLGFIFLVNSLGVYLLKLWLNENWNTIGLYILALSFWIFARSALNPIAALALVLKKNHYSLIFNIYLLLVNFISIYIGVLRNDFSDCVWSFSILSGIGYLTLLVVLLINLKRNVTKQF